MKTLDLSFRGKLTANVIKHEKELPKKAMFFDCDNLKTSEGLIGEPVNIYIYTTPKKGTKYFAVIKQDYYPSYSDVYGY